MDISKAIEIIKSFEGIMDGNPKTVNLDPYLCPAGYWTIGWGHVVLDHDGSQISGKENKAVAYSIYPNGITKEEAEVLLTDDVRKFSYGVGKVVKVSVNENQFCALVSFAFNVGLGSLKDSTLLRKLNSGDISGAADQFLVWNKATVNGVRQVLDGLVRRRTAERKLFLA